MLGILIPLKYIQKKFQEKIKSLLISLFMMGPSFLCEKKNLARLKKKKNNICINVFCYEHGLTFPIYVSDQKFENAIDILLVIDGDKSDYLYIKDFNRFMLHKTKNKDNKYFYKSCLQCFAGKKC